MTYITQGTIQVELKNRTAVEIRINPAQDYSVKHEKSGRKTDYIVFINDQSHEAKVFEKTQMFISGQSDFLQHLTDAAFKQSKIELRVTSFNDGKSISGAAVEIEIESIKIPATF